jgi:serine/threonine-protein phosphatase 5
VSSDGELEQEADLDRPISEQDKAKALEVKARANKAFAGEYPCLLFAVYPTQSTDSLLAKDFNLSIDLYTEAIALDPHDATFWNNRAMAKAKMEEHGAAIADASGFGSLRSVHTS